MAVRPRCYRAGVKVLVICRLRPGVGAEEIRPHAAAEMDAVWQYQAKGTLTAAFSPGGPGAVLIFDATTREAVEALAASLPLALAGLIDTEVIELHPFPALSS